VLKPDQVTAQLKEIPPVTVAGQATVQVDNRHQIDIHVDANWVKAQARSEARSVMSTIPLASSGASPGAISMPGAATSPSRKPRD
jgi:hypothetical protein